MQPSPAGGPQRATQGFVSTLGAVWRRPSLTAIEIAWRWAFGIPAIHFGLQAGAAVLAAVPWTTTGIASLSPNQVLTDPLRASTECADFLAMVLPGVRAALLWLAPLLLVWWLLLSTLGRTALLRRMNPALHARRGTLLVLQLLRLLPIAVGLLAWWLGEQWMARVALVDPVLRNAEPNTMLYVGGSIVLSLGLFVVVAGVGWVFTTAPVLAMRSNLGPLASLRAAMQLRNVRGALFEINMVLAIVKIMLLVLAMAFSAFPLPFANVMTEGYILLWSAIITVWYFAASDFFHVARLQACVTLLGRTDDAK